MSKDNKKVIENYEPSADELKFIREGSGLLFQAKAVSRHAEKAFQSSETLAFAKWLRTTKPELSLKVEKAPTLALHSHDFWFPVAMLASDTAVQFYIGLVVNYVYAP